MSQNIAPAEASKSSADKVFKIKDSHSVTKRLQGELMRLMMSDNKEVSAFPDGDNLFKWVGTIIGPLDTVYEGLIFKLSLEFPSGYPYNPPTVKFVTCCFHPNVDNHGNICLDILKDKWSALYDVQSILLSIQSLLGEPNNESPLNGVAAELWPSKIAFKKQLLQTYRAYQEEKLKQDAAKDAKGK